MTKATYNGNNVANFKVRSGLRRFSVSVRAIDVENVAVFVCDVAVYIRFTITGRRYIFEYVLINGKTNLKRHADELIKILKGRPCHINLIRLNAVSENDLEAVSEKEAYNFLGLLTKGGLSATLRRQMGVDIDGACGQLRQKYMEENDL